MARLQAGWDQLPVAPQVKLVVVTLGLLDHEVHRPRSRLAYAKRGFGFRSQKPASFSGALLQMSEQ
jgi:hypothetical protein